MSVKIRIEDGPYGGNVLAMPQLMDQIGLGVDDNGAPDQGKPPPAMVIYKRVQTLDGMELFRVLGFQRRDGGMFSIEFADGPAAGFHPAPRPARFLEPNQTLPLTATHEVFRGEGEPAAEAVYELRQDGGGWKYFFVRIDDSREVVDRLVQDANEYRINQAMKGFYENPNYEIYSKKPTGKHPQVKIKRDHREAHVDEKIAPVIEACWDRGFDTLGSCQGPLKSAENAGRAYIGFPIERHGKEFHAILTEAGIESRYDKTSFTIGHVKEGDPEPDQKLTFDSARLVFPVEDFDRIVEALRNRSS